MSQVVQYNELQPTESFSIWVQNSIYLYSSFRGERPAYDFAYSDKLEWPSLTVEWLPGLVEAKVADSSVLLQRVLVGTHTSNNEPNYLIELEVQLPTTDKTLVRSLDESMVPEMNMVSCILHEGEWVASKGPGKDVYLFNMKKHSHGPGVVERFHPDVTLEGHKDEGFGLVWSPLQEGLLASGSQDGLICLWDCSSPGSSTLSPLHSLSVEDKVVVNDVCFHPTAPSTVYSVCEDGSIFVWDLRASTGFPCYENPEAHSVPINAISFCPHDPTTLATASSDHTVVLWDNRNLRQPMYVLSGHEDEVLNVAWSPLCPSLLASSGKEGRVFVWDVARIGEPQIEENKAEGPPELLFVHNGHEAEVSDISWNPEMAFSLASVSTDNTLQMWKMSDELTCQQIPMDQMIHRP